MKFSLRRRILGSVLALIVIFLLGSAVSLFRISGVNRTLKGINQVAVPLNHGVAQLGADSELLERELQNRLAYSRWSDVHWRPRTIPPWMQEMIQADLTRLEQLIQSDSAWSSPFEIKQWVQWIGRIEEAYSDIQKQSQSLQVALEKRDYKVATTRYGTWMKAIEDWTRELSWATKHSNSLVNQGFSEANDSVSQLKMGLQLILMVVIFLSFLILWVGERTLRPLGQFTELARRISQRGLRKEDKTALPRLSLTGQDEVSQLAREFHRMATTVLEREITVQEQKEQLEDTNHLLMEVLSFNEDILNSIESVLVVSDSKGNITHANPAAVQWLDSEGAQIIGTRLMDWAKIQLLLDSVAIEKMESVTLLPSREMRGKVFGGRIMPLKQKESKNQGVILVVDDLTEQHDLEKRLRLAENLAAVGRMSAQVAHEVRNPLHSIGLEAEMALERASQTQDEELKQSLASVMEGVERIEKITESYLKLTKLSSGTRSRINLGDCFQSALAIHSPHLQHSDVRVHWQMEKPTEYWIHGDRALLEQAIGNLIRNSIQALEGQASPQIKVALGHTEQGMVWLRIEDNGVGVPPQIEAQLFQPFVTSKAEGTGLGLSFVQQVVHDLGGRVDYEEADKTNHRGALFTLLIPGLEWIGEQAGKLKGNHEHSISG